MISGFGALLAFHTQSVTEPRTETPQSFLDMRAALTRFSPSTERAYFSGGRAHTEPFFRGPPSPFRPGQRCDRNPLRCRFCGPRVRLTSPSSVYKLTPLVS